MLKKVGQRVLLRKSQKNQTSIRETVPFKDATQIGILVKRKNQNVAIVKKFLTLLRSEGKELHVLYYNDENDISKGMDVKMLGKKDINWIGKFKPYGIKKFIKTEFDYLFCLNTSPFLPFENVVALSRAKCRIGIYNKRYKHSYELMIHTKQKEGLARLAEQMIFYVKQIK